MEILPILLLALVCLIPGGISLKIEADVKTSAIEEGSAVTITCTVEEKDMVVLGELKRLAIEEVSYQTLSEYVPLWRGSDQKRLQLTNKTTMIPVLTLGQSSILTLAQSYRGRAVGSGTLDRAPGNLTLSVSRTMCTDGPAFVCVAHGPQGTLDSQHYKLKVAAVPDIVHIDGGRTSSTQFHQADCDIYARPGDRLDLYCTARIAHPLSANTVSWSLEAEDQNKELKETDSTLTNSTHDDCSGTIKSSLIYYHESYNVAVVCDVDYITPVEPGVSQKTGRVVICTESDRRASGSLGLTQEQLIGIFIGVVAAMLLLFILIIIIIICCCGYRIKAVKKNSMDLNGTKL